MKRTALLCAALLLLAVLCACATMPVMDLSGFLQTCRELGLPLELSRLYRTEGGEGEQYWLPQSDSLSLRLFAAETGALYECRVLLRRLRDDGAALPLGDAEQDAFLCECSATLQAFCGCSAEEADRLLSALGVCENALSPSAGTLTLAHGSFTLTLQTHPLETAFSVRDTRLREAPTYAVPESRPLFGDTTATRRETVPHR